MDGEGRESVTNLLRIHGCHRRERQREEKGRLEMVVVF